jgi:hypothetical protein
MVNTLPKTTQQHHPWVWYLMILILIEKIVQHIFVTLALALNWSNIRSTVVVNPDGLMFLGGVVAVLFLVTLWGTLIRRIWAVNLATGLALFDIVGEFVAQGTIIIGINASFLIAALLLVTTFLYRRKAKNMN